MRTEPPGSALAGVAEDATRGFSRKLPASAGKELQRKRRKRGGDQRLTSLTRIVWRPLQRHDQPAAEMARPRPQQPNDTKPPVGAATGIVSHADNERAAVRAARRRGGRPSLLGGRPPAAAPQLSCLPQMHDHARADLHPVVEVDDVLVAHADAARRDRVADRPGLVGAVDAVSVSPRYMARAPSGLSGPPFIEAGSQGWRLTISGGGVQSGHSALRVTVWTPDHSKPGRPTPTP